MIGFNLEEGFQAHLDANPEDSFARMVFADWLEERDDPRAEGYRAMGVFGLWTYHSGPSWSWYNQKAYGGNTTSGYTFPPNPNVHPVMLSISKAMLHHEWFLEVRRKSEDKLMRKFRSRREAEDAAAIGFSRLSQKQREAIWALSPRVTNA